MEALALYLLKSVIWLTGFTLVFILFLRNERFFLLNRIYLLAGILTSFLFPLISIRYTVVLPVIRAFQTDSAIVSEIQNTGNSIIPDLKILLLILYVSGVLFMLTLIIRQSRSVLRAIKRSGIITGHPVKLIKTTEYTSAFSFFSYVFVNPSITDIETKEIMNHELVHIGQKHWLDLLLVELLCMMQWFNPLVWIYVRFIRQNHEYLADEVALQRTSSPAIYRAALLNQIVGAPVVSLTNSFNYSLNKKRFNMMKNIINSPYRKMKILLILPVFAIVLYAFAKPDYKYKDVEERIGKLSGETSLLQKSDNGSIINSQRDTLKHRTSKAITPPPTPTPAPAPLPDSVSNININDAPPPPPPPPPAAQLAVPILPPLAGFKFKGDEPPPLWVVDGIIMTQAEAENIDPNAVESISVLKKFTDKYGSKGKDGVIEITTKKFALKKNEEKLVKLEITENGSRDTVKASVNGGVQFRSADGGVASPLVVVDGVILNIDVNKIDPETIQSISVIKEGPAFDKYGKKAKDGVIEITTKKNVSAPLKVIPKD